MDEFGVLTERFGLKPQGKSAPMAAAKQSASRIPNSSYGGADAKAQKSGSFVDDFDIFGGFQNNPNGSQGSSFDYDSIFGSSSAKASFDDDIFGGISSLKNSSSSNKDDIFGSFSSRSPNPNANPSSVDDLLGNFGVKDQSPSQNGSGGFDEFLGNFGLGSASTKRENVGTTKSTFTSSDDPFVVFESSSTKSNSAFTDPLVEFKFNHSGNAKPSTTSSVSSPLKPPPKPGQVLKAHIVKSSAVSSIDELEDFATGRVQKTAGGFSNARPAKPSKYREAEDAKQKTQQKSADDLESFFSMSSRSSSAPKSRATTSINSKNKPEVAPKKSTGGSSGIKKASSTTNIVDDLSSVFGDAQLFGEFEDVAAESEERRQARLGRHMRTQDRVAKAVADMNQRDFQTQQEQEERSRIADRMDFEIKRWAAGKEGNLRALLSSLQYVLWPECGWEPVSLTDLITSTSVKKVYRKATLCVHPDKVQQKGATIEQKYTAEKVFDILKEAWNKFNKEELS